MRKTTLNLDAPEGELNLSLDYRLDTGGTPLQLMLENLRAEFSNLSLKLLNTETPFVELKKIELDSARVDLASATVEAGRLLADGGRLQVLIDESGQTSLQQIVRKKPEREADQGTPTAAEAQAPPSPPGSPPWTVAVDSIELKDIAFGIEDMSRHSPLAAGISNISFKTSARIETGPQTRVSLRQFAADLKGLEFGPKGATKRSFEAKELSVAGGDFDLDAHTLKVASVRLAGGRLDAARDREGRLDAETLFSPKHHAAAPERKETEAAPERHESASVPPAPGPAPWQVDVEAVEIKDLALGFEDHAAEEPLTAGVGSMEIRSRVKIEASRKIAVAVTDLSVGLKDVRIGGKEAQRPLFETRQLTLEGGDLDLAAQSMKVARIGLNDGRFELGREADGRMNFERFLAPRSEAPAAAAPPAREAPWKFFLKDLELTNFRTALLDGASLPGKPLYTLQNVRARMSGVDGKSPTGFEIGFDLEQGGKASVSGTVNPAAPSVEARISAAGLSLAPLQPYIEPFITLTLQSAAVTTEGLFRFGLPNTGSSISYEGSLSLDKLALNQPGSGETFVGWSAMQIPRLKLTLGPDAVQLAEIRLSKPVGQLIIMEDRTFNLAKVIKERKDEPEPKLRRPQVPSGARAGNVSPPPKAARKPAESSFSYNIGRIRIEDGNVVFADLSLTPKFMTRIHGLKGAVSNLSSEKKTAAEIGLDGLVNQYGMVRIGGSIDLTDFKRHTDITLAFRNVEMADVTTYSGKFAGRKIVSGKLSTDLKYRIQDTRLVGENQIIVDNLVLGEKVESPDAVNLPLDLAVALLSDSNGRIDIGLPVSGDLNDPQFSIGPLIWKGVMNIIGKAVTAPFRALGGLFGGGEEKLDTVLFDPGKAELLPPEKEKLKKVADALGKRPQLKLTVRGQYSPALDGLQFRQIAVLRALAAAVGLKQKEDGDLEPLDPGDSKTRRALEKLFVARFGSPALDELDRAVKRGEIKPPVQEEDSEKKKAKKRSGIARVLGAVKFYKVVPGMKSPEQSEVMAGEMYTRLVESEPLNEDALRELAGNRTQVIVAELQTAHGVTADRLGTAAPEPLPEGEEPGARLSLDALSGAR